jgi:branched-chain amino acid transport system substrate-binding protein
VFQAKSLKVLLCCGAAVGAVALTGCGSSSSKSSSNSGGATSGSSSVTSGSGSTTSGSSGGSAPAGVIKIGVEMPITGPLASLGTNTVNAAKYAAAKINAAGGVAGHKLQILSYDTMLDPATAASDYTKAATQDKVVAMVGPLTSAEVSAVLPVATRTSTLDVIPAAADTSFTSPAKPYVYRTGSDETEDDASMASEAKELGCTKPALIYDNGTLGLSTKSDIAKDIPHFVTSQQFSGTATDLTPTLQAVKSAGAQCIIEATDDLGALGSMVATMANTNYTVPVLGDSGTSSSTFVQAAGASLKKVPVYSTDSFDPTGSAFKQQFAGYKAEFGAAAPPVEETGAMWDAVHLIAIALKSDGGKGGSALNTALNGVGGSAYTGIGGAAPGFSSSNHEWTTTATDRLYRVLPGTVLTPAKGNG